MLLCKIIWRADGTVKTPVNGFLYIAEPGEVPFSYDLPDLVSESDDEQNDEEPEPTQLTGDQVQRGNRNAYELVVFLEDLGYCCVIGGRMYPLRDFQRVPL